MGGVNLLNEGFAPTLFILPLRDRKKRIRLKDYFGENTPPLWNGEEAYYTLTPHDIARAKVYLEQSLDIYLALMVEYYVSDDDLLPMRLLKWFPKLSGVVSETDDVWALARYLDTEVVEVNV